MGAKATKDDDTKTVIGADGSITIGGTKEKKNTWIKPVAITAGVAVVGIIAFGLVQNSLKKKKEQEEEH